MAKSNASQLIENVNSERGQSVVEYILLLAVIVSLAYSMYSNPKFKTFFGKDGFFAKMKVGIESSYRYGIESTEPADAYNYMTPQHKTYYNSTQNSSRFFSPLDEYGAN